MSSGKQVVLEGWKDIDEIEISIDLTDPAVAKEIKTLVENCEALDKSE